MFNDGCSEGNARRRAGRGNDRTKSPADWLAVILAVPAGWLFWIYVALPTWDFVADVSELARADRARMEMLSPMLGRCYVTPVGAVGAVIRIENSSDVKMAFKDGIIGNYPVAMLKDAECPRS